MEPVVAPPPPPPPPPTWVPDPRTAAERRALAVGSGAATTVAIGATLVAGRSVGLHLPACPFLTITGVPCPFCGFTRLASAVAHLRLGDAVAASPAGVLVLVGLVVVAATFLLSRLRHRPPPSWLGSRALAVAALLALGAHWATSIVVGLPT